MAHLLNPADRIEIRKDDPELKRCVVVQFDLPRSEKSARDGRSGHDHHGRFDPKTCPEEDHDVSSIDRSLLHGAVCSVPRLDLGQR